MPSTAASSSSASVGGRLAPSRGHRSPPAHRDYRPGRRCPSRVLRCWPRSASAPRREQVRELPVVPTSKRGPNTRLARMSRAKPVWCQRGNESGSAMLTRRAPRSRPFLSESLPITSKSVATAWIDVDDRSRSGATARLSAPRVAAASARGCSGRRLPLTTVGRRRPDRGRSRTTCRAARPIVEDLRRPLFVGQR